MLTDLLRLFSSVFLSPPIPCTPPPAVSQFDTHPRFPPRYTPSTCPPPPPALEQGPWTWIVRKREPVAEASERVGEWEREGGCWFPCCVVCTIFGSLCACVLGGMRDDCIADGRAPFPVCDIWDILSTRFDEGLRCLMCWTKALNLEQEIVLNAELRLTRLRSGYRIAVYLIRQG